MLQSCEQALHFSGFQVPAHRVFYFKLLLLLVQLSLDNVKVDRIDDEILQFTDTVDVQNFEQLVIP